MPIRVALALLALCLCAGGAAADPPNAPDLMLGAEIGWSELLTHRERLPPEVWRYRDRFFHPGMRMQIGPALRDYPFPAFFRPAAGDAPQLDAEGNLHGHTPGAGLPFPPEGIDPAAADAAARWAWNFERRHRGAGPRGSFRLVDLPSRVGAPQTYHGEWFQLVKLPAALGALFAAGGRFHDPNSVRHLAWRQLRPNRVATDGSQPDESFVYLPDARKVRRASGGWVDGLFTPSYRARARPAGPGASLGGAALAATEAQRRGWLGLSIRPNAYHWRLLGERRVLAPLNVSRRGYPLAPHRSWGPSELSPADDRWELRRAVMIEGALREGGRGFDALILYLDAATLQPLYFITRRRDGRLEEVGILLHRFSDDVAGYPAWPTGGSASVFDPVAAVFVESAEGGSGWRRESYDLISIPPHDAELERLTSPGYLTRGR